MTRLSYKNITPLKFALIEGLEDLNESCVLGPMIFVFKIPRCHTSVDSV